MDIKANGPQLENVERWHTFDSSTAIRLFNGTIRGDSHISDYRTPRREDFGQFL